MSDDVKTGKLVPYLVEMFRAQAWIGMGKVANPVSGKIERDLTVAKAMIDLLAELEQRTEGHRSQEETKILQGTLTELRLNYVDELKRPQETPAAEKTEAKETEKAAETDASAGKTAEKADQE